MIQIRSALNYLVIGIMIFMTAIAAVFIYFSLNLKSKITLRTVQQTEFASDLLARSATDIMKEGHSKGRYFELLAKNLLRSFLFCQIIDSFPSVQGQL